MVINKVDSNVVGLSFAEEVAGTPKVLPGSPIWYSLEPNGVTQFGTSIKTVARNPLNPSRQKRKGTVTDVDAAVAFASDVTTTNLTRLYPAFLFADAHEKADTAPLFGTKIPITGVTGTTYTAASGLGIFKIGDIILGSNFALPANNGIKVLSASASGSVTTTGTAVEASPAASAEIEVVGFQFTGSDATMAVSGGVATLGATTKDLTELNLNVGEWIGVGGDATGNRFSTSPAGWARVFSISATGIVFDKVTVPFVNDAGAGKAVRIFFGKFIRNEKSPSLIKTRTYNFEGTFGNDGDGIQSEYVVGSVANTLSINIPTADKVTVDLGFVGLDGEIRTGLQGVKAGARIDADVVSDALNTSTKVYRTALTAITSGVLQPEPLFAHLSDLKLDINNNVSALKAVGTIGGFDINLGEFAVTGTINAYFQTLAAVQAIRNNTSVTLDIIFAADNKGVVYDIPLLTLGDGAKQITANEAIKLSLTTDASEGSTGYTLGVSILPYIPTILQP